MERDNPGLHLSILPARSGLWSESNSVESCLFISEDFSDFTSKESFEDMQYGQTEVQAVGANQRA